jgi:hypothetical protein
MAMFSSAGPRASLVTEMRQIVLFRWRPCCRVRDRLRSRALQRHLRLCVAAAQDRLSHACVVSFGIIGGI